MGARGPVSYANWVNALSGAEWEWAYEVPLFTDARVLGDMGEGLGPYRLLNGLAFDDTLAPRPAIVVYVADHLGTGTSAPAVDWTRSEPGSYSGGGLADEVAALVSLCLGIRLKAGHMIRSYYSASDLAGRPEARGLQSVPYLPPPMDGRQVIPRARGDHNLIDTTLVQRYPKLSPRAATALVRAARLYQDAMWISDSDPATAWLLFVSAIEAAAQNWKASTTSASASLSEYLPELSAWLAVNCPPEALERVAKELAPLMKAVEKFRSFVMSHRPEPPQDRAPTLGPDLWEPDVLVRALGKVYGHRSKALHGGIPIPLPMCGPPQGQEGCYSEVPSGIATATHDAVWLADDTPMLLHTFEYITRGVLLNWWRESLARPANTDR